MTSAIPDSKMFQAPPASAPKPPQPRSSGHVRGDHFEDHLAEKPTGAREEGTKQGDQPTSTQQLREPAVMSEGAEPVHPVPEHLRSAEGLSGHVYAWGLHVNGYLSEVNKPSAAPLGPAIAALADSDDISRETRASSAFLAGTGMHDGMAAAIVPTSATAFAQAWVRAADPEASTTSATGVPTSTNTGTEPFQRTLFRWSAVNGAPVIYVRDFRLTRAQANDLATRIRQILQEVPLGMARLVINGQSLPLSETSLHQGASACPSTP